MLQESLGGNAKTSLVIAVANAEDHIDESLQSLQFGSRAMRILTRAVVNERMDVKVNSLCKCIKANISVMSKPATDVLFLPILRKTLLVWSPGGHCPGDLGRA